ncbi:MAG: GlsB/YeaQ/YmgE family stress response membrane protein [Bacteroidetes bacterium]|nr:MAG: GlsB/YeaQ/YmgE family stress response membrane protein [Bacteroidota bacterium]
MGGIIGILVFLAIGAIAGWLAGVILKGSGFGLLWNIIIGIVGGILGGWLFGTLFGTSWIGGIITAVIGAIILLFIASLFKRK